MAMTDSDSNTDIYPLRDFQLKVVFFINFNQPFLFYYPAVMR